MSKADKMFEKLRVQENCRYRLPSLLYKQKKQPYLFFQE